MAGASRRRRRMRTIRPGDGRALRGLRWWQLLSRTVFFLDATGPDGSPLQYAVDVHYLADELDDQDADRQDSGVSGYGAPPVALYADGAQQYVADLPAAFPVPGGVIEVATNLYGLTRMHVIEEQGGERTLRPHPRSLEGLRARFDRRFPTASRLLGASAVLVLLISLAVTIPQLLELVTTWEIVAERVGTVTSPIQLPTWANTSVLVAGMVAATERALTLRHHWLIDADTTWTDID